MGGYLRGAGRLTVEAVAGLAGLESIDLVTHSMGGLVARGALHPGTAVQDGQDRQEWPCRTRCPSQQRTSG